LRNFWGLVENETIKLIKRKRFLLVVVILAVLVSLFAYGQKVTQERLFERVGTTDWRPILKQQIADWQNRLKSPYIPEDRKNNYQIRIEQAKYDLEHDINPTAPGSATFVRTFMDLSIGLLLPLLIVTLSADLVSSEWGEGTIKLLLTRPVPRYKILLSKFVTLFLFVSLTVVASAVISAGIGGIFFGWSGWEMPVATGFRIVQGQLDTSHAFNVPQWEYILESYGLGFVVALVVGIVTCMVSVLVRSTAAAMGIMLAAIIGGNILANLSTSWTAIKYLFVVNLNLTGYLSGQSPPIEGMTLPFSLAVLLLTAVVATGIAFWVFVRRDVLA
jgi:ABC-2 type transport system permease protein